MADEDGDPEFTFSSYEDADHFIEEYEIESGYRHVKQKSKRTQETDITSIGEHKLLLVDKSQKGPTIGSECVFVVVGTELRECMHGMKRQKRKEKEHIDHDYRKSRTRAQDTKKMGCQAKIYIKTILKFPDYKFPEVDTKHNRTLITKRLKQEFSSTTRRVIQVIVKVVGEHSYHDIGEAADFNQPLDKRVVSFIKKKVSDGIRNVDEVMSRVNDLDAVSKSRPTNRRFHPARKTVYNIMYNEINSVKYVKDDQVNTGLYLEEKRKNKDDSVFFRPSSDPETDTEDLSSLLFVYQSKFQKNILQKYRKEVAILDATYNTTKFELPLYMVAVQTNSGFVVVGSFIVGRDTKLQVEEALGMIKSWNPTWSPRYFLTDYDLREIGALENTFKGVQVFLCQFHVIQAWKKWLSSNKDLSKDQKETLLETLRAICNSSSEETYSEQVSTLKDTEVYRNNKRLRGWLEARWFPEHKRWVDYNREEMTLRNDTTNGLEVQHRLFKENFLKKYGFGGSLQSVVEVLIEKYCPAMEIRYKEKNAKASSTSKLYSDNVPEFLRNRPSDFVKHCLQRMPPKVAVLDQSNVSFDSPERCQLRSPDSDITYSLSFVNMMPVCSCLDFKKKHWPCKHLLGVMLNFPDYSWESLNAVYTGQNCFSLDQSLTNEDIEIETSSQPLHADSEDTEESFLNMQKKCLLLIPEIQNNIYCVNNIEILQETHSKLNSLNTFLMKNIPKLNRLPLRKNRQRKIRKIKRLTGKKTEKFKTHAEKGIKKKAKSTEVSQIDVAKVSQIDAANESNLDQQCRRALQEIWEGPGSDEPVVQIGPFTVTKASLHYLKSTLSDELIDAYLSLLVKGSDILHINCVVATAIFTGNSSMHSFLTNTVLGIHDTCICAVNEGGVHWVLVIIQPKLKKIIYMNPLGELDETCQRMLHYWYNFLAGRQTEGIEEFDSHWEIETRSHGKQTDGSSCGIYVLTFAEKYINGEDFNFDWGPHDVLTKRVNVGKKLLLAGATANILSEMKSPTVGEQDTLPEIINIEDSYRKMSFPEDSKKMSPIREDAKGVSQLSANDEGCPLVTEDVKRKLPIPDHSEGLPVTKHAKIRSISPENADRLTVFPDDSNKTESETETSKMKEQKNSSVTGSFTVEPRKRRKIKRSSFVYFTPKKSTGQSKTRGRQKKARKQVDDKTELLYCVCRKPDDGSSAIKRIGGLFYSPHHRHDLYCLKAYWHTNKVLAGAGTIIPKKYWQCENCCNWFHPVCVGMKEDEEPWTYICKTCQDKQSKKETIKKKHDGGKKDTVKDSTDEEVVPVHEVTREEHDGGKKDTVKDSTDEEVVPVHEVTREEHDGGKKDTVKDSTDEEVVPVYEVTREEHDGGKDTVKDSTDEEVVPVQEVTSEAQDKEPEDFEPTPWFQPVKTGQKVPGGLYVKMDLKTGETLAKLVEGTKEYKRWEEKQRKVNVEKAVESEGSEEFEEFEGPDEKNFFVNKETAEKNIGAAFARLDKIIRLAESSEKWMKRHHIFRSSEGSAKVVWKGYGYAIFSVQAIQFMEAEVKRRYFTDVTSKIYSRHGRIVGMLDEKMNELFANDRFLAEIYLMDVLVTESLAAVLQESTGLSYRRVDMECKAVEGKSNVTALKAGLELSAKKKQELEEAMVS